MVMPAPESAPLFREHLQRVLKYLDEHYNGNPIDYESDNFKFMALTFLSKQRTHARSLLSLGKSRDVLLVARTMIEGHMFLYWAELSYEERALTWRAFIYVRDWRKMVQAESRGETVNPKMKELTVNFLRAHEHVLTTPESISAWERGKVPDRYVKWGTPSVRKVFKEAKMEQLYLGVYKHLSAYHHWDITGFIGSLSRDGQYTSYTEVCPEDELLALVCASSGLTQTAQIANGAVEFCPPEELDRFVEQAKHLYTGATTIL